MILRLIQNLHIFLIILNNQLFFILSQLFRYKKTFI